MSTCEKCRSREDMGLTGTHWLCNTCFKKFYKIWRLKVEEHKIPETEANALACLDGWLAAKPTENQPAQPVLKQAPIKKEKPSRSKEFWDSYAGY